MKRKILYGICLFGMIAGCTKEKEEHTVKFPVKVNAFVSTYDQYGVYDINARVGVSVLMKAGTTSVTEAQSDATGLCVLQATTGTYHFECNKSGYAPIVTQAYQFMGGDVSYPVGIYLREVSTTRFEDVALSINAGQVNLGATVYHNYPYGVPDDFIYGVDGIVFMSTSPDVSSTNYLQIATFPVTVSSGKTFTQVLYGYKEYFPSGSTLYVKMYGVAHNEYGTYNVQTGKYSYTTLGSASTTTKIVIP